MDFTSFKPASETSELVRLKPDMSRDNANARLPIHRQNVTPESPQHESGLRLVEFHDFFLTPGDIRLAYDPQYRPTFSPGSV